MRLIETLKEAVGSRLAPLRQAWEQRPQREQQMLLAGAAAVLLTLVYLVVWEPAQRARVAAENELSSARATAQQLERAAALVPAQRAQQQASAGRDRSLLAQVNQATRSNTLGKSPERLQPDGEDAVRVWLEDVQLEALLRWLVEVEQRGLRVVSADVERRDPGLASARLQIERGS